MTYVVHHVDAADSPQLEEYPSLEEGLARVEALRNDGDVSEVRVFKEIPIEVRTYYRVVAVEDTAVTSPVGDGAASPVEAGAFEAVVEPPGSDAVPTHTGGDDQPLRVAPEPPSGAMVMGPPPVTAAAEVAEPAVAAETEHRRPLFGRG